MASGEPTDPTVAVLAKVMGEMGFESGLIAEVTGVPRGTISDIVRGHNIWQDLTPSAFPAQICQNTFAAFGTFGIFGMFSRYADSSSFNFAVSAGKICL